MSINQRELLQSQLNVEGPIKGNYSVDETQPLIEYEHIDGTPFTGVKRDGKYYLMLGNKRLNEIDLHTPLEAAEYLIKEQFNLMLKMAIIVAEDIINNQTNNK